MGEARLRATWPGPGPTPSAVPSSSYLSPETEALPGLQSSSHMCHPQTWFLCPQGPQARFSLGVICPPLIITRSLSTHQSLRPRSEVGQEGQGEVFRKVTSYGVSWLCFWGGKSRGSMKFGTQSPGPSRCRARPAVVTIPGSGVWEPEADHPNRKPGVGAGRRWGRVGTLGPACQHHSGCGERRKQSGVGVGRSSALRTTGLPVALQAHEGLGARIPVPALPPRSGIGAPHRLPPSLSNICRPIPSALFRGTPGLPRGPEPLPLQPPRDLI